MHSVQTHAAQPEFSVQLLGNKMIAASEHVPLRRTFSPLHETDEDASEYEIMAMVGGGKPTDWLTVEKRRRAVILAGAGVGKTHEMMQRARAKAAAGCAAFFIRIEDIDRDFDLSFEVGDHESFEAWLASSDDAWFFLDSVDEARLGAPRAFERAIKRFADKTKTAWHRLHVVVSSRPYAWRSRTDHLMMQTRLPFDQQSADPGRVLDEDDQGAFGETPAVENSSAAATLKVYMLNDLNEEDIRVFAETRGVADASRLVDEVARRNLSAAAARPFDLESIVEVWKRDGQLGSRLDFLNYAIDQRLAEIEPDRDVRQPLNRERARAGARSLAAAVLLTGKAGIRVPDASPHRDGIDALETLGAWEPRDVHALLERGIFDDAIYGKVRFRHREIRELLAAEWLAEHLKSGNSRNAVENLIFRETYGHTFLSPLSRPVLPWLILMDDEVRSRVLSISPEVVAEGGDPSRLPLQERRRLLREIVDRIAKDVDQRSARDNDAIGRIAETDLSDDVLKLIEAYRRDDSVLFFLGRLVWQGEMTACVEPMADVAADQDRDRYARIAAVRSVATAGSREVFESTWDEIVARETSVDRSLAAEIVQNALSNEASVERLLPMIGRVAAHRRYDSSGLSQSLHDFIDGFELEDETGRQLLARLAETFNEHLGHEPHLDGGGARISKENGWLLNPAAHAVERLVCVLSAHALDDTAVAIVRKVSSARAWHDVDLNDHAKRLQEAVSEWSELNDRVFWAAIAAKRAHEEARGGGRVIEPYHALYRDDCRFGGGDFDRVRQFIRDREHEDDKHVAVSLAFRLIKEFELGDDALHLLRSDLERHEDLTAHLERLIDWKPSKAWRAMQRRDEREARKRSRKDAVAAERHRRWIAELKSDPTRVRRPEAVEPGQMTGTQFHLMQETRGDDGSRWGGDDWRRLLPEFGEEVAAEYRDAAMSHWRVYKPALASEDDASDGRPFQLDFGLAGLEIEAEQDDDFPKRLSDDELRLALRYAPCELDGFPTWLERAFRDRPEIVVEAILAELAWDLERVDAVRTYVLHDLVYHAPWLHPRIADWVIGWLEANDPPDDEVLRYALSIAKQTDDVERLLKLAGTRSGEQATLSQKAKWFALEVDIDADAGVPRLEYWLEALPKEDASKAAQHFITDLLGSRRRKSFATGFHSFRTPACLKRLFLLMHQYIRANEDIERSGTGVYSPGLRDDAQDARNSLLELLRDIPGKPTFAALLELAESHPVESSRAWLARLARARAEMDGDIEVFSDRQFREFDADQSMTPATNTQLFDIAVERLIDIRAWLERGDDSPYRTWQRVPGETEMHNLVAGQLTQRAVGRYGCAQENEMPNAQRPDIWVTAPGLTPVPIELKLLDKGWSGPQLCERLRNQLAGDYLRAEGGGRGVMLLISQGPAEKRRWKIGKELVDLEHLESALQGYWRSIAPAWPAVDAVKVLVIDLAKRGRQART